MVSKIISKEDIKHIAKLAEFEFSDSEIEKITRQLDRIIEHVAKIGEANTEDVDPTFHVLEVFNVFREDTIKKSLSIEESLSNAPEESDGGFKVPKID